MTTEEFKSKLQLLSEGLNQKKVELSELFLTESTIEGDEAIADFNIKQETLMLEISALEETANKEYSKFKAVNPVSFDLSTKSLKAANGIDIKEIENLLTSLSVKSSNTNGTKKRTVGQYIGDYVVDYLGIKTYEDFDRNFTNSVKFSFQLAEDDKHAEAEVKSMSSIKGLYSNNGVELVNGAVPVPGFQGYGCSIFEISDECMLCVTPSTFADFVTMRTMPSGNVIQYDFPVSRDDNAAAVLEHVTNPYPTVIQNGRKPESVFTYNTAKVNVSKIAHWIEASDDVLEDCSKVADRIDFHLKTGLQKELDRQLIAGTGTNGELLGLLLQPGRLSLNGTTLTAGIPTPNIYDKLYMAKLQLENNCAVVDGVIVNPLDKAKVALAKDTQGNYLFPQTNCDTTDMVGCMRLRTSPDVPVGTAIIGEFANNWLWYVRKNLEVRVGMKGTDFIDNIKTFLAEVRGASLVICPQKIATVTNI